MNAKLAKKIRKQALEIAVRNNLEYVDYGFDTYKKVAYGLDGKAYPYTVYTAYLKECQRRVYKQLKKGV